MSCVETEEFLCATTDAVPVYHAETGSHISTHYERNRNNYDAVHFLNPTIHIPNCVYLNAAANIFSANSDSTDTSSIPTSTSTTTAFSTLTTIPNIAKRSTLSGITTVPYASEQSKSASNLSQCTLPHLPNTQLSFGGCALSTVAKSTTATSFRTK